MYYFSLILAILLLFGTPSHGFYCIPCPLTQPCPVPAVYDTQYTQLSSPSCQPMGSCPCQQPTGANPGQSMGNFPPMNLVFKYDPKDSQPEKERQPSSPSSRSGSRFLTSLFSIPGAIADSIMSGEINL